MSYSSENTLPAGTRIQDVRDFVSLLGYEKVGVLRSQGFGRFEEYAWFDSKDYRSWTAVELSIHRDGSKQLVVGTRTTSMRSFFDLAQQNRTISALRKRFGGDFTTDLGRGRYMKVGAGPVPAPASGCFLAYHRFGQNLIKVMLCQQGLVPVVQGPPRSSKDSLASFLDEFAPRIIANNALVPFLVAACEDFFKSSFVALLRYSPRKATFLKNVRLQGDQLLKVANGDLSVEEQVAETLPFQRPSAVCRHFALIDPELDIAGAMRRPYRRRAQSLFDSIESLVLSRHDFIHRAIIDRTMTERRLVDISYDLEVAITRVYRRITQHYGWPFESTWTVGRRPPRERADKRPD